MPQHPSARGFAAVLGFMKMRILENSSFPKDFIERWEKVLSAPVAPVAGAPSTDPASPDTTASGVRAVESDSSAITNAMPSSSSSPAEVL